MIKFYDIDQNSDEWDEVRSGLFTSSTFSDLFMAVTTKGYKKAIIKVAYERITGETEPNYSGMWMKRGHEREPIADANYELYTFRQTENGGFHKYNEFVGASPDRKIVGENGGCEYKCPSFNMYNEYLETKKIPKGYYWQIHGQLLCTGWDFIDYMPFVSPKLKQILIRVERDEVVLEQLREQLKICIDEVKILIERIKQ